MISRHIKNGGQENITEVQENSNTNKENTISSHQWVIFLYLLKVYLDGLLYGNKERQIYRWIGR